MKISIIMPVFNEERTLPEIIKKVISVNIEKELIIVDDGSSDKTKEILGSIKNESIKIIEHTHNKGKGAAIRTALEYASGEVVIIQDADLEYDPADYIKLLEPIENGTASVVYGSRFFSKDMTPDFLHYLINHFLTSITNLLFFANLTDMETCYKVFKTSIIKEMNLESNGFEIEPELTIKVLKKGYKIFEVPISYRSRSYHDGKKIGWLDGVKTLYTILKYKVINSRSDYL